MILTATLERQMRGIWKFSTAALYVFHTASRATFGTGMATTVDVTCSFDYNQRISCWVSREE